MAIFYRQTKEQWKQHGFKYKGLAWGFIPVYVSDLDEPSPMVATRNWVPDWPLDLVLWLYFYAFLPIADPYGLSSDGSYPIAITGELK